ncbi:MAG: aminomethyl-transferring glycine dehydrogenase subunit GcvPA [Deltaproteobacteria bacterium]|nr:aminomethyl-transferring glycine dehydrogenase subunit GcvPA [Deltaproteobacteria bacterium]MBN2687209.1 aminomethyl-transferring glycine dehydrogenase subunit GcvPA [Deltaproteobacteria bacterium]
MDYIPHTADDIREMLQVIGVESIDELFCDIPETYRLGSPLNVPEALSEQEISALINRIAGMNAVPPTTLTGAGAYSHYIPAVVGHIISRSEFYTAYTPYQAEISQGILQAIYEYQTMIAGLTGMKVANASMYDGASAMAEAAVLAGKTLKRNRIILTRSIHPEYRTVVATYCWANGYDIVEIPYRDSGRLDASALGEAVDDSVAAVIVQSPNFFGVIEDIAAIEPMVHAQGAMLVAGFTEATSLGILRPAGEMGADIAVGEGQSFGNPLNYGGPYLGIFAGTEKLLRKIPGRLSGATVDQAGQRGFVLTLQAREQHIRRERATSNICTNEALCALAAAVYLASLGKNLTKLAQLNVYKAQYLKGQLLSLKGWEPVFSGPFYNEFVLRCPNPSAVNQRLADEGIVGGYEPAGDYPELDNTILLCATEMLNRKDMDKVVSIAAG